MLHGFAGTARHWDRVSAELDGERYSPLALELAAAEPLTLEGVIALVADTSPERFVLCGYSMGGRLALNVALALPGRVSGLVIVSASAGIDDARARTARLAEDERLAAEIRGGTLEEFIARWRATALFANDPDWVAKATAADTRRLTTTTIAQTLLAWSPGRLEPVTERLHELTMPATVLAGERDRGYVAIARRLARELPQGRYVEAPGAGHRVTLEAPGAVAAAIARQP
jgi:2-succinyl-6-hydroxy-2,4-cyclohexadiene-1-carboxylate synthase